MNIEDIRRNFDYNKETGEFRWSETADWKPNRGREITCKTSKGYYAVGWRGKTFRTHTLIWWLVMGRAPNEVVDHKNGNTSDTRWENLREATWSQNGQNRALSKHNKSGASGVHWCNTYNKWNCQISVRKKRKHLGYFEDLEEAKKAVASARVEFFQDFATLRGKNSID